MQTSRKTISNIINEGIDPILVVVDDEDFLLPPLAALQTDGSETVYLTFGGDAPMIACPISRQLHAT